MQEQKKASLGTLLGRAAGKLGGAPNGWIPGGGNLMGPAVQGLLTAGLGYGGGRLLGNQIPGIDAHRLGLVMGAMGGAAPWAAYGPSLSAGAERWQQDPKRGSSWLTDPANFLRHLNDTGVKQASLEKKAFGISSAGAGKTGFGIPVSHTLGMIRTDPMLSPIHKARAIAIVEAAEPKGSGIISWPTVTRAAVGAGIGFTSASLFGKALDTVFGGLSSSAQRKLQGVGTIAGILLNTGAIE